MITLQQLQLTDLVDNFPALHNANMVAIKQHIDDLEFILTFTSKTLKLTNFTTPANGGIEAATLTLTAVTGNAFTIAPNGGSATYNLTSMGEQTLIKLIATGTGISASEFIDLNVTGNLNITGDTVINGFIDFNQPNTQTTEKYEMVDVIDSMTGASASNPLNITKSHIIYLNCHNSGSTLANGGEIKLDTSGLKDGQIIKFYLIRSNAGTQKLFNGSTGAEVFARMTPTVGIVSITAANKPTFAPQSNPDDRSYLICQWIDTGNGYRLLILDSENIQNI